jgi:tetratricopeptide (TPR) repeat protein
MTDDRRAEAMRFYQQGHPEAAAQIYTQLLAEAPTDAFLLYGLGLCHFARRQFPDAERLLEQSRQNDPSGGVDATFFLAEIARQHNDPIVAAGLYDQVLAMAPHHGPARQQLTALRATAASGTPTPAGAVPPPSVDDNAQIETIDPTVQHPTSAAGPASPGVGAPVAPPLAAAAPSKAKTLAALLDERSYEVPPEELRGRLLFRRRRAWRSYLPSLYPVVLLGLVTVGLGMLTNAAIDSHGSLGHAAPTLAQAHRIALAALAPAALLIVGLSVLRSLATEVFIYERRIDYCSGVISRLVATYWFYDMKQEPVFGQTPDQVLTVTGTITWGPPGRAHLLRRERQVKREWALVGLGTPEFMTGLAEQLRFMTITERRAMLDRLMAR